MARYHHKPIPKEQRPSMMKTLKNCAFAIAWLFRISPWYVIGKVISSIDSLVILVLEKTFLVAYIIKVVEEGRPLVDILPMFIPVTAIVVFNMLFFAWVEVRFFPKAEEKIHKELRLTLYKKAAAMDMAQYDDPAFYNDFVWAMQEAPKHVFAVLTTFSTVCSTVVLIALMGGYVIAKDPVGLIFVGASITVTLILGFLRNKVFIKREEERVPVQRRAEYIRRVFYLADYAKDLRLGDMNDMLYDDFDESEDEEITVVKKHVKPMFLIRFFHGICWDILPFDVAYMTYLLYQTLVVGGLEYSALYALYRSTSSLQNDLSWMTNLLPEFQEHALYIDKLLTFLKTENKLPDNGRELLPKRGDLVLENVRFAYPAADEDTLKGISMTLPHGSKIAFVGYNGAGKSTLVKLLMRLYDPTSGGVQYGGRGLGDYALSDYRSAVAVLFQDYQIIAATLADNVTMGAPLDEARLLDVLHKVGFDEVLQTLPLGIHTPLTKEFDESGVNLSGGEAQKIAIARVLYSDAQVLILDEPSSALDPLSEYRLNETIRELADDKTVIFISHRLSTTRMADTIFMLEDGQVIERGSHETLMAQNGKYAAMFRLQAEKYR